MLVAINEEYQRLLGGLKPDLQTVARMKLEGYTNREIADQLGRVERTVERKLDRIRRVWLRKSNDHECRTHRRSRTRFTVATARRARRGLRSF